MIPKFTKEQAAIIGAYTGYTAGPFNDLMDYAKSKGFGNVSTIGMLHIADDLKVKAKEDFLALCHEE